MRMGLPAHNGVFFLQLLGHFPGFPSPVQYNQAGPAPGQQSFSYGPGEENMCLAPVPAPGFIEFNAGIPSRPGPGLPRTDSPGLAQTSDVHSLTEVLT